MPPPCFINRILPSTDKKTDLVEVRPNRFLNVICLGPTNNVPTEPHEQNSALPKLNLDTGCMEDVGVFPNEESALFFIHGVGGSSEVWRAQYEYFAEVGFNVIVPDLIGHGRSDAPNSKSSYHFAEIGLDILAIFDRFQKRRNVLIGHSYGASFASLVCKERESLVTKLVLISGGDPTALAPQTGVFQLPICILSCFKPFIVKSLLHKAFYKSQDEVTNRLLAFSVPTYVLRYIMRGQIWPEGDEEFYASLLLPTLLIYGTSDALVSVEEELVMKDCINGSRLVLIDECSHMVPMEKPDIVNKFLQQFLALNVWQFEQISDR